MGDRRLRTGGWWRLRRAFAFVWAYPQIAGLIVLLGPLIPLPALLALWVARWTAGAPWAAFFYLPLAFLVINASLVAGALGALAVLALAAARLKGEKPGWGDAASLLRRRAPELLRWGLLSFGRSRAGPYNPFTLPALVAEELSLEEAARRAEAFRVQRPAETAAAESAQKAAGGLLLALLLVVMPFVLGFLGLPLASAMGWDLPALGDGAPYRSSAWLLTGALGLGFAGASLALACAKVYAAAVYLGAAGPGRVRESVLRFFEAEDLFEAGAAAPAPPPPAEAAEPPPPSPFAPRAAERLPPERPDASAGPALPAAGRSAPLGAPSEDWEADARLAEIARRGAPPAPLEPAPLPPPAPRWAPALARTARIVSGLFWAALLVALPGALAYLLGAHHLAWRAFVLAEGRPAEAEVLEVRQLVLGQTPVGAVVFRYEHGGGSGLARAMVSEAGSLAIKAGDRIEARYLEARPERAAIVDDYGFSRQRAALILLVAGLCAVGLYSYLIRRL